MQQVLDIIRHDVAADKIEIDNPTQNLESYFLEVVRKAKEGSAETSGATSGSRVAAYLRGDAESRAAVGQNSGTLDRVRRAAARRTAPAPPSRCKRSTRPNSRRWPSPPRRAAAAAAAPQPAPPADLNKANEKLSSLLGKPNEK